MGLREESQDADSKLHARAGQRSCNLPKILAVSMVRCNTGLEFTCGSFKVRSFSWALIEAQGYPVEVGLGIAGQVGFLWKVQPQQPVGVFVGAALPRALRITEVDLHLRVHREALVSLSPKRVTSRT
jgi:hypothetical protein